MLPTRVLYNNDKKEPNHNPEEEQHEVPPPPYSASSTSSDIYPSQYHVANRSSNTNQPYYSNNDSALAPLLQGHNKTPSAPPLSLINNGIYNNDNSNIYNRSAGPSNNNNNINQPYNDNAITSTPYPAYNIMPSAPRSSDYGQNNNNNNNNNASSPAYPNANYQAIPPFRIQVPDADIPNENESNVQQQQQPQQQQQQQQSPIIENSAPNRSFINSLSSFFKNIKPKGESQYIRNNNNDHNRSNNMNNNTNYNACNHGSSNIYIQNNDDPNKKKRKKAWMIVLIFIIFVIFLAATDDSDSNNHKKPISSRPLPSYPSSTPSPSYPSSTPSPTKPLPTDLPWPPMPNLPLAIQNPHPLSVFYNSSKPISDYPSSQLSTLSLDFDIFTGSIYVISTNEPISWLSYVSKEQQNESYRAKISTNNDNDGTQNLAIQFDGSSSSSYTDLIFVLHLCQHDQIYTKLKLTSDSMKIEVNVNQQDLNLQWKGNLPKFPLATAWQGKELAIQYYTNLNQFIIPPLTASGSIRIESDSSLYNLKINQPIVAKNTIALSTGTGTIDINAFQFEADTIQLSTVKGSIRSPIIAPRKKCYVKTISGKITVTLLPLVTKFNNDGIDDLFVTTKTGDIHLSVLTPIKKSYIETSTGDSTVHFNRSFNGAFNLQSVLGGTYVEDIDNAIEWDIKSGSYKVGRRGKSSSDNEIILKSSTVLYNNDTNK
ncbi:unnamed protein product [Cunninghamella echinulata]